MSKGLFITGTDTEVGKTYVAARLLRWLRGQRVDAVPMKPVQTGADGNHSPDLATCLDAAGLEPTEEELRLMAPYCYEPACSPHLAGRIAGESPSIDRIAACARALEQDRDCVLAEGAGGVLVPLDESSTMLDLMRELGYPVLLVARAGLGTINHSLLSLRTIQAAGLRVKGIVFNEVEPLDAADAFIRADNPRTIARMSGVEVLGTVRHGGDGEECFPTILEEFR
jgi:dethiobiotin synthase